MRLLVPALFGVLTAAVLVTACPFAAMYLFDLDAKWTE